MMRKLQRTAWVWMVMVVELTITATGQSGVGRDNNKGARSNDGSQVEVKKDEFSGVTTITLKPQKLIDSSNHQLTMAAETKLGGETPKTGLADADETVQLKFISLSNSILDFGDEELHFLVDGKPVRSGPTAGGTVPKLPGEQPSSAFRMRKRYFASLSLSEMRQVTDAKVVTMRLGTFEMPFDSKLLSNLRDFVRAANRVTTDK